LRLVIIQIGNELYKANLNIPLPEFMLCVCTLLLTGVKEQPWRTKVYNEVGNLQVRCSKPLIKNSVSCIFYWTKRWQSCSHPGRRLDPGTAQPLDC